MAAPANNVAMEIDAAALVDMISEDILTFFYASPEGNTPPPQPAPEGVGCEKAWMDEWHSIMFTQWYERMGIVEYLHGKDPLEVLNGGLAAHISSLA